MRFYALVVVVLVVVALVATVTVGRGNNKDDQAATATPTQPSAATVTMEEVIVGVQDLPGCTVDREGAYVQSSYSRSFNCQAEERLTETITIHAADAAAERHVDNAWGTMDGARDQIRSTVLLRPVDPSSLTITNASQAFGKLGAEQEYVYCAAYTDASGTVPVTEYFGAFRYRNFVIVYSSFATSGGRCDGQSRALENGRQLASKQLAKLRAAFPPGSGPVRALTPTPSP